MNTYYLLLNLAWRNLWRNSRRTLITAASVMFAVILALAMESMNTGQHEQMIGNTLRFGTGYLQVMDTAFHETPSLDFSFSYDDSFVSRLEAQLLPGSYLLPRIASFVLAAGENTTRGAFFIGTDSELENRMNGFQAFLKEGTFFDSTSPQVVVGMGLAQRLSLSVGDTLVLLGQGFQGVQAAGKFKVAGLLKHPIELLDNQIIYTSIPTAAQFFDLEDRVSQVIVMTDRDNKADAMKGPLQEALDNDFLQVYHWKELEPELLQAIAFDSVAGKIFQLILYIVIGFGIFGTVLTMTLERQKEFAIMVGLGMKRRWLALQCFFETIFISFLGVLSGLALGYPIILYLYYNPIPMGDALGELVKEYGLEPYLPVSLAGSVFLFQGLSMLIIALLITAYPVYRSFQFKVLENLQK